MILTDAITLFYTSMAGVRAHDTIVFYKRRLGCLEQLYGGQDICTITIGQLRQWRQGLSNRSTRWGAGSSHPQEEGGLSTATLHQYIRAVRRLFRWLWLEGYLPVNTAHRLELPRLPRQIRRGISKADRDRIIMAARSNPRDYAMVLFLADTGCRLAGAVGLTLDRLDISNGQAFVTEKYGDERIVFFTRITAEALQCWLDVRQANHRYVFTNTHTHAPLGRSGIYMILKRTAMAAGVRDGWNPHNWRHGALRGMLSNGLSLPEVAWIAGHRSVYTTGNLYGTFSENELKSRHKSTSWLN